MKAYSKVYSKESKKKLLSFTMRLLTRRIGEVAPQFQALIQQLATSELEELGEALLNFNNASDLAAWLQQQ